MRKNALIICCFVCAAGAFGTFFRWLQNQIVFDTETGLVNPSVLNVLIPLLALAAAVLFFVLCRRLLSTHTAPVTVLETFRGSTVMFPIVAWVIASVVILGGIVTLVNTRLDAVRGMYRAVALLAVLTGVSFPLICTAARRRFAPVFVCSFMTLPIILMCVWLVTAYRENASNPTTWVYAILILAIAASAIAFYQTAGCPYGRPKPFAAMFSSMLATFLCFMALADNRYFGLQLLLLGTAGMLMMETWMIVANMREKSDEPVDEAPAETPPEEPEEEPGQVIEPGDAPDAAEPTRRAP